MTKKEIERIRSKMKHKLDLITSEYSEETLKENSHLFDRIDWSWISAFQKLSEGFIREFKDEVYWYRISIHQKLSEAFIREFKDKVVWYYISKHQKLSKKFMMDFIHLINVERLEENKKTPLEDKQEIIAYKLLVG